MIEQILVTLSDPLFVLFSVVFSIITILFFVLKKRQKVGISYSSSQDLLRARKRARNLTFCLRAAALAVIVSLGFVLVSNPNENLQQSSCKNTDPNRRDTIIITDISASMIDTSGIGFKFLRSSLMRILEASSGENVGLTFFSSTAFSPIFPTRCHAIFRSLVHENLYKTFIFNRFVSGTDGSSGLIDAYKILMQSNAKVKRIVFIGDLEDNDPNKFLLTLKQVHQNGIDEITVVGIKSAVRYYAPIQSFGFNVIKINNEADLETLGPLPTSIEETEEEISFSNQLGQQQITIGKLLLVVVMGMVFVVFYIKRSTTLRRKQ